MKRVIRELTPPFLWNLFHRMIVRPLTTEDLEKGWERDSSYVDAGYKESEEYRRHYAESCYYFLWCVLIDRIHPTEVRCVLDIGCGPGQFGSFLHDRGLRQYVGVDFSSECIRMARSACPSFEFVCANAFASDVFDTLDYDVVVATEFLEHVERDLMVLDRIRPGTRVYGSVPNFPHPEHVRCFKSSEEVYARYSSRFSTFRVDEFLFGSKGMSFFLFEGIRVG